MDATGGGGGGGSRNPENDERDRRGRWSVEVPPSREQLGRRDGVVTARKLPDRRNQREDTDGDGAVTPATPKAPPRSARVGGTRLGNFLDYRVLSGSVDDVWARKRPHQE